ncbi:MULTISPECIES: hypothetical protein [Nocardia]|uniref:Uncharacterized protein n=1 Tax=Nocardia aurea TaxID=2144174 RepID=A0ABV3FTZ8_9NOCA|nr:MULTISPECIES: hypothetical protein [Nocardia]
MNGIVNISAIDMFGGGVRMPISASRGVLALQGTGLSFVGALGGGAKVSRTHQPICASMQDKTSGSWHPEAVEVPGGFAFDTGYEQASALLENPAADTQAARLRTAHPATVIRNRHRCRSR